MQSFSNLVDIDQFGASLDMSGNKVINIVAQISYFLQPVKQAAVRPIVLCRSTACIRDWEMLVITMVNLCNIFIVSGTCKNGHRDNCLNRDNVAGPQRLSPTTTLHNIRLKPRNVDRKPTAKTLYYRAITIT